MITSALRFGVLVRCVFQGWFEMSQTVVRVTLRLVLCLRVPLRVHSSLSIGWEYCMSASIRTNTV